jgi:hypothetical protein
MPVGVLQGACSVQHRRLRELCCQRLHIPSRVPVTRAYYRSVLYNTSTQWCLKVAAELFFLASSLTASVGQTTHQQIALSARVASRVS